MELYPFTPSVFTTFNSFPATSVSVKVTSPASTNSNPIIVLETNLPGVFMAGVVGGGLKTNRYFIENTRHHAEQIVREIELRESIA